MDSVIQTNQKHNFFSSLISRTEDGTRLGISSKSPNLGLTIAFPVVITTVAFSAASVALAPLVAPDSLLSLGQLVAAGSAAQLATIGAVGVAGATIINSQERRVREKDLGRIFGADYIKRLNTAALNELVAEVKQFNENLGKLEAMDFESSQFLYDDSPESRASLNEIISKTACRYVTANNQTTDEKIEKIKAFNKDFDGLDKTQFVLSMFELFGEEISEQLIKTQGYPSGKKAENNASKEQERQADLASKFAENIAKSKNIGK